MYRGIATEPFMPYIDPRVFIPHRDRRAMPFPGPGWHRGPAIASFLPPGYSTDNEDFMAQYGRIGDVPFSTVVGPVNIPNRGFDRPAPFPITQATVPAGLPGPIYPGPGWHVGPSVHVKREYAGAEETATTAAMHMAPIALSAIVTFAVFSLLE